MVSAFAGKRNFQVTVLHELPERSKNYAAVLTKSDTSITIFNHAYSENNPEAYQVVVTDTSLFSWAHKAKAEKLTSDFIAAAVKIPNVRVMSGKDGVPDRFPPKK